jgi:prepilin-type N-terminal cleavage/methylation domain-containing protein
MIRIKNKQAGFTLIEAMMAVAIVALVLTPLFMLETNVFTGVVRLAEQFQRSLFARTFLYRAQQQESPAATEYSASTKEERPLTAITYTLKPLDPQSKLAGIAHLYRQEVVATGISIDNRQREVGLVHFIYKPAPPPTGST